LYHVRFYDTLGVVFQVLIFSCSPCMSWSVCVCILSHILQTDFRALQKYATTDSSRHLLDYSSPWIMIDLYFILFILCTIHKRFTILNKHYAQTCSLSTSIIISQYSYMFWSVEFAGDHEWWFRHNRSTTDHIICIGQILEKNGNTVKLYTGYLQTSRKLMNQLGGKTCITFSLSVVSPWIW
jgi:hypothetical protein